MNILYKEEEINLILYKNNKLNKDDIINNLIKMIQNLNKRVEELEKWKEEKENKEKGKTVNIYEDKRLNIKEKIEFYDINNLDISSFFKILDFSIYNGNISIRDLKKKWKF